VRGAGGSALLLFGAGWFLTILANASDPSLARWVAAQRGVERVGSSDELYRLPELP
jgi:hypothetical protein